MHSLKLKLFLAEIDKIANNTAFNGVKVLDGSYNSDIRAGNTNPEVINIAIDRMNTDTLGGVGNHTLQQMQLLIHHCICSHSSKNKYELWQKVRFKFQRMFLTKALKIL